MPGAGKSSVATALMRRYAFGIHIPVDNLRELVVAGIAHPVPEWTEETGRQFRLARTAAAEIARTYHEAGFAVAIDDVIDPGDADEIFGARLAQAKLHKIVLYPSFGAVLERNRQRGSKNFDTAVLEETIHSLHARIADQPYQSHGWQIVDTTGLSLEQTVDEILAGAAPAEQAGPPVDKRGVLDDEIFSYRTSKEKVFIAWHGKQVMVLKGKQADRFLAKISGLSGKQAQLVMAKITGNFKRGNER